MQSTEHWEGIYSTKPADSVSWFQQHAGCSLRLIRETGVSSSSAIIDAGGGASTLVDDLLLNGFTSLTVLDLSLSALRLSKSRIGTAAENVQWLAGDIVTIDLPAHAFDLWHDRAVFHFLTTEQDRQAYVKNILRSVKPGGHVIVATFAAEGPPLCSGLPVSRYTPETLHAAFGDSFSLMHHETESHCTPSGSIQQFIYCCFRIIE